MLTIKPFIVPISPRTRVNANSEDNTEKSLHKIKVTKLSSFLKKESLKIVADSKKWILRGQIDVMGCIDDQVQLKLKVKSSKKVIGEAIVMAGLEQEFEFEIPALPPQTQKKKRKEDYLLEIGSGGGGGGDLVQEVRFQIDLEKNIILKIEHYVYDQKDLYEIVEVYGQGVSSASTASGIYSNSSDSFGSGSNENSQNLNDTREDTNFDEVDCVVCLSNPRNTILIPCRHMCICSECTEGLINIDGKCPLCRQVYCGIVKIDPQEKDC